MRFLIFLVFMGTMPAWSKGEKAGEFDYYVMALSWTPNWCVYEGDRKNSEQCEDNTGFGFTLHGLWPQYERGWPSYCPSLERAPSRSMTGEMSDIMGTSGLAWHQWRKHGVCSGLSAKEYFELSRRAYEVIKRPQILRDLESEIKLPAKVIEEAFLESNPQLQQNQITITCKANQIQEARICLDKNLELRKCGSDVINDCKMRDAVFYPIRK